MKFIMMALVMITLAFLLTACSAGGPDVDLARAAADHILAGVPVEIVTFKPIGVKVTGNFFCHGDVEASVKVDSGLLFDGMYFRKEDADGGRGGRKISPGTHTWKGRLDFTKQGKDGWTFSHYSNPMLID